MTKKIYLIGTLLAVDVILLLVILITKNKEKTFISPVSTSEEIVQVPPTVIPTTIIPTITIEKEITIKNVLWDVPFTCQAPFGQWSDPRQQDACEETAALMAVHFAKKQTQNPTKEEALKEILDIVNYQINQFNEYRDTSAFDTAERVIKGYYGYNRFSLRQVSSAKDIILQLLKGNVVIVPVNGRLLNNPNFTAPGPERHMVLVRGYDLQSDEFITNDPGIWQGEKYRYPALVLFAAIRDYSTGFKIPITEIKKTMIVVEKE